MQTLGCCMFLNDSSEFPDSCSKTVAVNSTDSLDSVMDAIESRKPKSLLAVGINCSAPRHVEAALKTMAKRTQVRFALSSF
jgi:S-methylmethionine-dependent homocysteine/selenocysteine methylase